MFKQGQWRTVLAVTATMGGGVLALPSGALAASSGSPLQIGTTDNSATPAVVVDSAGTAYVAWTVPAAGTGPGPDQVEVCSIPAGGTSCSDSSLLSAPGNPAIGSVQLTIDGPDVVLVADQFQHSTDADDNYVNEWTAADGTVSFTAVDGGASVSQGQGYGGDSLFTLPNAGTTGGPLGYGFSSIGDNGGQYYIDVINPFNAAPECSEQTQGANNNTCPTTPQAQMAAPGDASSQAPNYYASESGANPGVLGVLPSGFSSDCGEHTAGLSFIYGSGDQSTTNSYGIAAGGAGSAWKGGPSILDCDATAGIAVSGSAGLGALTDDTETTDVLTYRTLNQATGAFNPAVSVDASEKASVSDLGGGEDGTDGVYATYENGNTIYKGPNDLSYSPDGGKIWDGPAALTNLSVPVQNSTSAIGSNGQGWLVWTTDNKNGTAASENLYVRSFDQQDVPADAASLATKQTHGSATAANLSLNHGVTGEFDHAALSGINAKYATGKVTYTLHAGSCTAAGTNEGTFTVANGMFPASKKITHALAAGKYYWVASYSGDRNNARATSRCGGAVLTIKAPRV